MHHNSLIVATAGWVPERCERDPRNFSRVIGLSFQGPRGETPSRCGAGESSLRCRGCQTLSSFFLNREFRGTGRREKQRLSHPRGGVTFSFSAIAVSGAAASSLAGRCLSIESGDSEAAEALGPLARLPCAQAGGLAVDNQSACL